MLLPFRVVSLRLVLVALMSLSFGLVSLGRAEAYVLEQARDALTDVARPVLEFFAGPLRVVRGVFGEIGHILDVHEENERLRAEVERLMEWKAVAEAQNRVIQRYEALLNVEMNEELGYVTGRVIADSGGPFVDTLIVNVGAREGVRKGQAVVAGEGVIGRIIGTGERSARVLLLTDLNSRIPVLVEPNMLPGILAGDNSARPRLIYVELPREISPGDRIITSDDGGTLPRGLPIGTVAEREADGSFRVEMLARRPATDFVRVVNYDVPVDADLASEDEPAPPFVRRVPLTPPSAPAEPERPQP
ncbi:MAG: rod shape-determining protein MreC, partial [Alphaproteobacteria bacterium]|nr:rod shape-determining protein MreC [Alphaproteobacteria bacterium]